MKFQDAPEPPSADRLAELRARLDAIDSQVHKLLRERYEIVEEIGVAKGTGDPVIRPGREAAVLENRLAAHTGVMPREVLAYLFRAVIGGACAVQRPFTIHVTDALEAARFLYGPAPMVRHASAREAVAALADRPCDVAVIADEEASGWWRERAAAHVIGRYEASAGPAALVLGGAGVAPGTGPMALTLTPNDTAPLRKRVSDIGDDEEMLGRYHPLSVAIPVAV